MKFKYAMLLAALLLPATDFAAAKAKARAKNKPRPQGRIRTGLPVIKVNEADKNLLDFSRQPFSDHGSHITALRKNGEGNASWDIISAMAFGSQAAKPHAAKQLFNMRVELQVGSNTEPLFPRSSSAAAEDYPRYSVQRAQDGTFSAESVLLYPEADALLMVATFKNSGKAAIRVRPRLVISGGGADVDSQASLDPKTGVLSLNLDRSRLVQRKLKESIGIVAGSGKSDAIFSASSMASAENLGDAPRVGLGGFTVTQSPSTHSTLKPGQSLRFPIVLSFGADEKSAKAPLSRLWSRWALPPGVALGKAKARWNLTSARLPHSVDSKFERLSRGAALTLLMNQYARRSELKNDMLSQAKGWKDGFFSEGLPMAALGLSELDHGMAEAALLELTSFSAAAPAPVPPHTGEELLHWEAAGLPLHGLAAFELYQRDPELSRAGDFLKGMGLHLRNESAWWPKNRDGDGNGLYAFANQDERPWYQLQGGQGQATETGLQTYNIALSALVAWQMQAASALATAAGEKAEADTLIAESIRISKALKQNTRSDSGIYEQGLDGMLPYIMGLDQDLGMARSALSALTKSAVEDPLPFAENGIFHPWQAYFMLKGLSLYGEHAAGRSATAKILAFLDSKSFFSAYKIDGEGLGAPGDASTAAVALEMALERHEQEAFLLADTVKLSGRFLQVRTQDGGFYLKRVGLSEAKAAYDTLSLESPGGGAILTEGAFVMSADKDMRLSLMTQWGLDLSEEKSHKELFKGTKRADLVLKAKVRYLVKIIKS